MNPYLSDQLGGGYKSTLKGATKVEYLSFAHIRLYLVTQQLGNLTFLSPHRTDLLRNSTSSAKPNVVSVLPACH